MVMQVNNFPTFYLIREGGGVKFLDKWKMGRQTWDAKLNDFIYISRWIFSTSVWGRTSAINCGSKVTNIKSASYGRTQKGVCAPRGHDSNRFCYSASSMRVTLHRCQGQHRCTVHATNSVFGDPCVGTEKYLEVCLGFNTLY